MKWIENYVCEHMNMKITAGFDIPTLRKLMHYLSFFCILLSKKKYQIKPGTRDYEM